MNSSNFFSTDNSSAHNIKSNHGLAESAATKEVKLKVLNHSYIEEVKV
jgi:hypothetical protein